MYAWQPYWHDTVQCLQRISPLLQSITSTILMLRNTQGGLDMKGRGAMGDRMAQGIVNGLWCNLKPTEADGNGEVLPSTGCSIS